MHRPSPGSFSQADHPSASSTFLTPECLHSGDVALVFGSNKDGEGDIQRFSCVSLQPEVDGPRNVLIPDDIPPIFESYAEVPPFHERPFQGILKDEKNNRLR